MHRFQVILDSATMTLAPWDRPVIESPSFIVIPSLGSLVPGWLLIIPRRASLCLRDLTAEEQIELDTIAGQATRLLQPFEGTVYHFEHGNSTPGGVMGCGVDQAHLHIVPLPFDLIAAVKRVEDSEIKWRPSADVDTFLRTVPASGEYISIWNSDNRLSMTGEVKVPRSQWVRRLIAKELGQDNAWDYRQHPQPENLLRTIKVLNQQ